MARVLAVADACDAMMSPRPYRHAIPPKEIENIMAAGAGSQWDPVIIRHFMACRHELFPICQRGIGESVCIAVEHAVKAGKKASWSSISNVKEPTFAGGELTAPALPPSAHR
jgi:hypothetical protein